MSASELAAWLQALFSAGALGGVFYAARQVRTAKLQMHSAALQGIFARLTSTDFTAHRDYVKHHLLTELRGEGRAEQCAVSAMPPKALEHVRAVSHYFDQLGILVRGNYVAGEAVSALMGSEIEVLWTLLKPHIQAEREVRRRTAGMQDHYQVFFEWLATTHGAAKQARLVDRIRKETASSMH